MATSESIASATNNYVRPTLDPDFMLSLPYHDNEYSIPGMKEYINRLIEQEMAANPEQDLLGSAFSYEPKFESEILRSEYNRVMRGTASTPFDASRYSVEDPPSEQQDSEEAWRKALENSRAQLEHQSKRLLNLELLDKYGANAWIIRNYQMDALNQYLKANLEETRQAILDVNKTRKSEQIKTGSTLKVLEDRWTTLVGQTIDVEIACAQLEGQVAYLRGPASQANASTVEQASGMDTSS